MWMKIRNEAENPLAQLFLRHKSEENASIPCFRQVISSSCATVVVSLGGPIMLERGTPASRSGFLTANR